MEPNTPFPEEPSKAELRRHDFLVALIVWCIALATLIESWHLTFGLKLPGLSPEKAWLVAPGIFPLALSAGLLLMFSVIIGVSYKEGEFKGHFTSNQFLTFLSDRDNLTQIAQISLLCLFVFGLLGRIHFPIAAALYLFSSMFVARAARWYVILPIAVIFSVAVSYLFGTVMKIPLP
jgi:hypothetical protein